MTYAVIYSKKLETKLKKLAKRNPNDLRNIWSKIQEIRENPEHYKPLSGDMKGVRRVHLNMHFVLTFEISGNAIIFISYEHHNKVYDK
jgi:YafQ family addiction module toxin component